MTAIVRRAGGRRLITPWPCSEESVADSGASLSLLGRTVVVDPFKVLLARTEAQDDLLIIGPAASEHQTVTLGSVGLAAEMTWNGKFAFSMPRSTS